MEAMEQAKKEKEEEKAAAAAAAASQANTTSYTPDYAAGLVSPAPTVISSRVILDPPKCVFWHPHTPLPVFRSGT